MLYRLKNGQQTGFVPGVGRIVNGQIESPIKLEGANFELVMEAESPAPQTAQAIAPVVPPASPTPQSQPSPQTVQNTNIISEVSNE